MYQKSIETIDVLMKFLISNIENIDLWVLSDEAYYEIRYSHKPPISIETPFKKICNDRMESWCYWKMNLVLIILFNVHWLAKIILNKLKGRRDICVNLLNSIRGLSLLTPDSTFYLYLNVGELMENKNIKDRKI